MDGNGNIQVNHLNSKSLQYRLVIKLSNSEYNYNILLKIAKNIGGVVIIVKNKQEVLWLENKKETIIDIINIFTKFPPLTSRLISQLEFLKLCFNNSSVKYYLNKRNFKYSNQLKKIKQFNKYYVLPFYFSS